MSLQPDTRLGTFEIAGLLGVGDMGEVYRATDAKLGREIVVNSVLRHSPTIQSAWPCLGALHGATLRDWSEI